MYHCTSCSRSFSSKGSLHRHEQNHKAEHGFACYICHVTFRRQDLLNRHAKIHSSDNTAVVGRKRARTACDTCRASRVRCSQTLPCERCTEKGVTCLFAAPSGRTSHDDRPGIITLPLANGDDAVMYSSSDNPPQHSPADLSAAVLSFNDCSAFEPPSSISACQSLDNGTPQDMASWPWLHESLFLEGNLNLDWYSFDNGNQDMSAPGLEQDTDHSVTISQIDTVQSRNSSQIAGVHVSKQEVAVDTLVSRARNLQNSSKTGVRSTSQATQFYRSLEELTRSVVREFELTNPDVHSLNHYVQFYEHNFWPLWPLIPKQYFSDHVHEPMLYLAMVSIGAMYGTRKDSLFGIFLHNRLRDELISPLVGSDMSTKLMLSLSQACSLTQAAALYFGHQRAFSYASHLGSALVIQARRMGLFRTPPFDIECQTSHSSAKWTDEWITHQCKIRLAFAILRLEMYTSALFLTRPLISATELEIGFPCSTYVWTSNFPGTEALAAAIKLEIHNDSRTLFYCDVFRIIADPDVEAPFLHPLQCELLMNASQEIVWMASSAKMSLLRLVARSFDDSMFDTGLSDPCSATRLNTEPVVQQDPIRPFSLDAHLVSQREMRSLISQVQQTTKALRKLRHHVLQQCQANGLGIDPAARTSVLSCLLAYHIGFLQLNAPINVIQQACHLISTGTSDAQARLSAQLLDWIAGSEAPVAAQHAVHIYHLLNSERGKPREDRAHINFLTMLGLYHSATVLWTYAKYGEQTQSGELNTLPSTDDFIEVFRDLNPAWATRSSFLNMLQTLR